MGASFLEIDFKEEGVAMVCAKVMSEEFNRRAMELTLQNKLKSRYYYYYGSHSG